MEPCISLIFDDFIAEGTGVMSLYSRLREWDTPRDEILIAAFADNVGLTNELCCVKYEGYRKGIDPEEYLEFLKSEGKIPRADDKSGWLIETWKNIWGRED